MRCWLCKQDFDGEPNWTNCRLLCPKCFDKPRHRYYYLNRPPNIGCQPDGFMDREAWMPGHIVSGRNCLGWVEYPEPLEPEQVWKWEFMPADDAEYDAFWDWREEHNR